MKSFSVLIAVALLSSWVAFPLAQTDLDAFMKEVLERRDDNWKKQQQYVLDERETVAVTGPNHSTLWGERRDYTWFIREGFFVRSPVKVNGSTVGEGDRREYENEFLAREKRRQARETNAAATNTGSANTGSASADSANGAAGASVAPPAVSSADAPGDLDALLRQTSRPGFISAAYFLRFKFDAGRYALVGRETIDGREVLKIEYYPTNLFSEENRDDRQARRERRVRQATRDKDRDDDQALMTAMNKGSKVTLWIDPTRHQILKYTFDDLAWDFLPGAWLVRLSDVTATMTVRETFPDVWLPHLLQVHVGMATGAGAVDGKYDVEYHDYRLPDVTTKIGVPGAR